MKPEELEKHIAGMRESRLPADWRSEILAAAEAAQATESPDEQTSAGWALWIWRELLAPLRHGWSALAALWIIMLGAQFLTSDGDSSSKRSTSSLQIVDHTQQELHKQRLLLAELLEFDEQKTEQEKSPSRPRSHAPSKLGSA